MKCNTLKNSGGCSTNAAEINMKIFNKKLLVTLLLSSGITLAHAETLTVATEPSFAPFEFVDKTTSELTGFDIDIINAIGEVENFKTNVISMGFDAQIPAIMTGQVDIAISGFTITEERAKTVNLTTMQV